MDQGPLVTEQIDAGAKLAGEFEKSKPLQAVFWLKASDDGQWYLYLVSDQINDLNFGSAYGEIVRLLGRGPHTWLEPIQVKVSGTDDPVAKGVLAIQNKYAGRLASRLRSLMVGGLTVDDLYIYPVPVGVPA